MKGQRGLTRRARDVLSVLCGPLAHGAAFTEPASVHAIADALDVSEAAVKQHLTHLYDKFGIFEGERRRRVRLANMALSEGAVRAETMRAASQGPAADLLADGRAAALLRNWLRAYELLTRADQEGSALSAEDLEWLGEAAMMTGRHDESIAARQRAHAIHVRGNNVVGAAGVELALVYNYAGRLNFAQASAWFSKAERSLEAAPPGPAHGYLAVTAALFMYASGNFERALELAREGCRIGEQLRNPDVHGLGLAFQGQALTQLGKIVEATSLFDEAMASATSGELGPLATGLVYCRTICSCLEALDYRRAREWTETIDRVAGDHCMAGFPGDCRAHRATLLAARGDWSAAESEARVACAEQERIDLSHSGIANYEIGQLRLRTGDFASATVAFQRAHELGMSPQPGLALLHLERGDIEAATASIRTAVEETAPKSLKRARLLQAHVEVAYVAGDSATARTAANELARIAEMYPSMALKASAMSALGVASLTEGKSLSSKPPARRLSDLARGPTRLARVGRSPSRAQTIPVNCNGYGRFKRARSSGHSRSTLPSAAPTDDDLALIEAAGHVTLLAIERQRSHEALTSALADARKSETELHRMTDAVAQSIVVLNQHGKAVSPAAASGDLLQTAARPIPAEAEGANRARSASEAFLYRRQSHDPS